MCEYETCCDIVQWSGKVLFQQVSFFSMVIVREWLDCRSTRGWMVIWRNNCTCWTWHADSLKDIPKFHEVSEQPLIADTRQDPCIVKSAVAECTASICQIWPQKCEHILRIIHLQQIYWQVSLYSNIYCWKNAFVYFFSNASRGSPKGFNSSKYLTIPFQMKKRQRNRDAVIQRNAEYTMDKLNRLGLLSYLV